MEVFQTLHQFKRA